jgi:two-component sensor histidine kinase
MNIHSPQWHRTRKRQLRMVWSSLILIFVLTLGLITVVHWPVRQSFERRDLDELRAYGAFVQSEVSSFLSEAEQLANQLPSRTRIREELVAYLQDERTQQAYVSFARPKLADAVDASQRLVAVYRLDPRGDPVVAVNVTLSELPPLQLDPQRTLMLPGSRTVNGHTVVFFVAPIRHEDFGLAGYDVVAISLRELVERTQDASERAEGAHVALASPAENGADLPVFSRECPQAVRNALSELVRSNASTRFTDGTVRQLNTPDCSLRLALYHLRDGWVLGMSQPEPVLFAESQNETRIIIAIVLGVGVVAAGVAMVVLRTLSRRIVSDTSELARIVADQTEDLELLLREIHHRVKNDIAMMTSFLALKASQTSVPEAEEALAEAQRSLRVMGRVYERLQHAGHYAHASLQPLLEGIIEDLAAGNGSTSTMRHTIQDVTVTRGIAIPLGIMVNELVTNALKHGEADTSVFVEAHTGGESNEEMVLSVTGGSEGFPEHVIDGEYGFGLTMVQALARQHGGEMRISNRPKPTVTVRMPLETDRPGAS